MKINLLPGRVGGTSLVRTAWIIVTVLLIAELIGLIFYQTTLLNREKQMAADVQEKQTKANAVEQIGRDATAERAKVAGIDQKVTFVKDLQEYNEQRPDLYDRTAQYTLQGIRYSSMSASQNLMQIQAWAPTLSDAGRYLLFMQNSPDFSLVRISGVPGYPPSAAGGAGGGSALGDTGGSGSIGFSGPGGGGDSGGFSGPTSGGGFSGQGPAAGGPATDIGPGANAPGGFGGGGGGFGAGGGGGGGGQTVVGGAFQNSGARNRPPAPPQGFGFTVSAQLVKPITRPIFGGQQQQGFGGGFGQNSGAFAPGDFGPSSGGAIGTSGSGAAMPMPGPGAGVPAPAGG